MNPLFNLGENLPARRTRERESASEVKACEVKAYTQRERESRAGRKGERERYEMGKKWINMCVYIYS